MRIKEIRINGIRGFKYIKEDDGSPLPHKIKLNGKHLFLYGENGTGKSSFCDAIEWCLTGTCEELSHRRIKNEVDFLKNKSCNSQDNPCVEILFDQYPSLLRELKSKELNFKLEEEAEACIIDSGRIEKFVIDTKSSIWERFSTLLGFENLISFDEKLKRLTNEAMRKSESSRKELEELEKEILEIKKEIKDYEHIFQQELGDNWQELSSSSHEVSAIDKQNANLQAFASNIKKYISNYELLNKIDSSIEILANQLEDEGKKTTVADIHKIIEDAYQYFEKIQDLDTCPICGNKIDILEIRAQLKNKRELIHKISSLDQELNKKNTRKIILRK